MRAAKTTEQSIKVVEAEIVTKQKNVIKLKEDVAVAAATEKRLTVAVETAETQAKTLNEEGSKLSKEAAQLREEAGQADDNPAHRELLEKEAFEVFSDFLDLSGLPIVVSWSPSFKCY